MARGGMASNKIGHGHAMPDSKIYFRKLSRANDLLIPRAVFPREIFQQLIATADQLEQPTSRGMVLLMDIEMLAKRD